MNRDLIGAARAARERAYAPYSGFKVGAAVEAGSGVLYVGCNVENASYGLTMCAERVAIFSALVGGEREIRALAVVSGPGASPCGACRQVLAEFTSCPERVKVIVVDDQGGERHYTLEQLLPASFSGEDLGLL
jgi:cytidine deaminase